MALEPEHTNRLAILTGTQMRAKFETTLTDHFRQSLVRTDYATAIRIIAIREELDNDNPEKAATWAENIAPLDDHDAVSIASTADGIPDFLRLRNDA